MRTGVLDRLGVGWEVCHERNPALVYAAVRGFGDPRTGDSPYSDWPAFDAVAQAMGGFVASTGPDPDHPMRAGPPIGDYVPGLMAAFGLLAALLNARETGQGQFVDVAMVDGLMSMSEMAQTHWSYSGTDPVPTGNTVPGITPFAVYRTSDGHCAVAAPTDAHWGELARAMNRDDLVTDDRCATGRLRSKNRQFVDETIETWTSSLTSAEVVAALGGKVSVGPVQKPSDWVTDPHVRAREMLVRMDHAHHRSTVHINCPIKFSATPGGIHKLPPRLDEDGPALRRELDERDSSESRPLG